MLTSAPWHYYVMAAIYMLAGLNHFRRPELYLKIMPPYLPKPQFLVGLSGVLEVLAGIGLLVAATKSTAIYLIIALLFSFFTVHIYMLISEKAGMGLPKILLFSRLLLQFGLIWWAFNYLGT
jgi:uncharacterized membrane protein